MPTILYDDKLKMRLKRVEGQIRGVLRMMEEEATCKEVVTQLTAARTAIDKAIAYLVATNMEQCILEELSKGGDSRKVVQEAIELLIKSR
ncbi:metal-sensitive transcriptional regulator [Calditerricola satsumensis]|uniref:Metal-sensitive transcriptional regulator n=2 Tax=Calditerricola satsumensis TaxID=373054 RepID=A0A8J3B7K1_9BACI|nr:hypothetical protein GCM10007043_04440 [Calditerricola satsumensis]